MADTVKIVFFSARLELIRDFKAFLDRSNHGVEHAVWPCESLERFQELISRLNPNFAIVDETSAYFDFKKFQGAPESVKKVPRFLLSMGSDRGAIEKSVREYGFSDVLIYPMDLNIFIEKLSAVLDKPMGSSKNIHIAKTDIRGAASKVFRVYEIGEYGCKIESDQSYSVGDIVDIYVEGISRKTMLGRISKIEAPGKDTHLRRYLVLFVAVTPDIQSAIRKHILSDYVEKKSS